MAASTKLPTGQTVLLEGTGWTKGHTESATIVSWTKGGNPRIKVTFTNRASIVREELYDQAETRVHVARLHKDDRVFHVSIPIGFQPYTYRFTLE